MDDPRGYLPCIRTPLAAMSRLFLNTTKNLAVLAVIMLPVQQVMAASCCCRFDRAAGKHVTAGSLMNCCSQVQASCCGTESISPGSFCAGQSRSDSGPCRCLAGLCGIDAPTATDSTTGVSVSNNDNDQWVAIMATGQAIALNVDSRTSSDLCRLSTFGTSTSGSERCVLLCRYRL